MSSDQSEDVPFAAIYAGLLWENHMDDILPKRPLCVLGAHQVQTLTAILETYVNTLSTHGWYSAIPDRTVLLPTAKIRLDYGVGDELGVRSLAGRKTQGFFRSSELVALLATYEREAS